MRACNSRLAFSALIFFISLDAFGPLKAGAAEAPAARETAVFAGGCFWCMQPPYDKLKPKGVISTTVGYTGGTKDNPTYAEVSKGGTGHRESIEVVFDPKKISYRELLDVYWRNIDPTDAKGQFCDKGEQYTSAIFFKDEAQKKLAEASKAEVASKLKVKGSIVTSILPASKFYPAEKYHQGYYLEHPLKYKYYRFSCGRDQRLKEVWGKSDH